MMKTVAAGMLCLSALAGSVNALQASPFPSIATGFMPQGVHRQKDVVLAQSNEMLRIGQLEEQIRALNGRIEEMSFQLLQMQEQMRKAQEDNEFRFQDLEKGAGSQRGSLDGPAKGDRQTQDTASADVPADTPDTGQTDTFGGTQELGSIRFDAQGNPIGADPNPDLDQSASIGRDTTLPGVDGGLPQASQQSTASLDNPDDLYNAAYGHVLSGDYSLAEKEFRDYLDIFPEGDKASDASFWLGEAQYSQGNFNEAAKTFLNAHQTYARSKKAPEMLLKLGMSLAALDNRETACATLREVNNRYPGASSAVKAKVTSEQSRLSC